MSFDEYEEDRPTRPTQPPTINDLIMTLTGTNELIIALQGELSYARRELSEFRSVAVDLVERVERLERLEAAE